MINPPKTVEEARAYRYGVWAGHPNGRYYVPDRCAYEVSDNGRFAMYTQCSRRNGHGPEGLYCKQHAQRVDP